MYFCCLASELASTLGGVIESHLLLEREYDLENFKEKFSEISLSVTNKERKIMIIIKTKNVVVLGLGFLLILPVGIFHGQVWGEEKKSNKRIPIEIGLTLSGGGVRAAAFSYGIMRGLDEIILCGRKDRNNEFLVEIDEIYISNKKPCKNGFDEFKLLAEANSISAVSGGTMTAIYYMTHEDHEFKEDFRDILAGRDLTLNLIGGMKARSNFGGGVPLSFPLLITSAIDTIKDVALFPFSWMLEQDWPFPNPDLTPALFLTTSRGLINPERLAEIYEDWFFDGVSLNYSDIPEFRKKKTELLINATDVKNRRPFTFDKHTFECLGVDGEGYQKFPLALASAASSALPVLFAPLNLEKHIGEDKKPDTIPEGCPVLLLDSVEKRKPELLDGGIQENLGLASLVRKIFRKKNRKTQGNPSLKTFLIVVNSAAPSAGALPSLNGESTMIQNVDESIDTLQRDKTDLARTIYNEPLNNFGFASIEFNFNKINDVPELVHHVSRIILEENGQVRTSLGAKKILEHSVLFTEEAERVRQDLEAMSMRPTKSQIDTLIAAGRAIVQIKFPDIRARLLGLSKRLYFKNCGDIVNTEKFYCWPLNFTNSNVLEHKLELILKIFSETTERFIKSTTENRARKLKNIQQKSLELRANMEKWRKPYRITANYLDLMEKDKDYFSLIGEQGKEKALKEFVEIYKKILNFTFKKISNSMDVRKINRDPVLNVLLQSDQEVTKSHQITLKKKMYEEWYFLALKHLLFEIPIYSCKKNYDDPYLSSTKITCDFVDQMLDAMESVQKLSANKLESSHWFYAISAVLNLAVDRFDDMFYNIYAGIKKFPEEMNFYNFQGYYTFLIDANIAGGVRYFQQAIDIAKMRQSDLSLRFLKSYNIGQGKRIHKNNRRFKWAQNYFTRQLAEYLAISPTVRYAEKIPTEEIHKILISEYPDGMGDTIVRTDYWMGEELFEGNSLKKKADLVKAYLDILLSLDGNLSGGSQMENESEYIHKLRDLAPKLDLEFSSIEDSLQPMPYSRFLNINDLAKASGLEEDSLNVLTTPVVNVKHGELEIKTNGKFTYKPNEDYFGTDSFTYEVNDANGKTGQATVVLKVINKMTISVENFLKKNFQSTSFERLVQILIQSITKKLIENTPRKNLGYDMAKDLFQENVKFLDKKPSKNKNKDRDVIDEEVVPGLMRHEIMYPYGLHLLVANAQFGCHKRASNIKTASDLLKKSKLFLLEDIQKLSKILFKTKTESEDYQDVHLKKIEMKQAQENLNKMKKTPFEFSKFKNFLNSLYKLGLPKIHFNDEGQQEDVVLFMELLYDLQFIDLFLKYADELECLDV